MPDDRPDPKSTEGAEYAERLAALQQVWWKRILPVQAPYRWNLRRLHLGATLEVGCGIGRNLEHLGGRAVGVDHNAEAVSLARARGCEAMTTEEFEAARASLRGSFDSMLVSHVLEHMTRAEAIELVRNYLPCLRPGGTVVMITPQERGFASDASHVEFLDLEALREIAGALSLDVDRSYSFPFPRSMGRIFVYNEFVVVATTTD